MKVIRNVAAACMMLVGMAGAANATPCRDAHGRFTRCTAAAPATAPAAAATHANASAATGATAHAATTRCRNAQGRFIACPPAH